MLHPARLVTKIYMQDKLILLCLMVGFLMQDVSPYASEDSYTRLLSAVVLPKLAGAITNSWEPRDPEPPLRFLELWADLLPTGVQRHILDTLILPKVHAYPLT